MIIYKEPAAIVGDILLQELELNPGQVMFSNQKYFIPTIGLFLPISYVGPSKAISSVNTWEDDGSGGLNEVQSVVMAHMIQIDIMAYNKPGEINEARTRKEEIIMALHSIYSQSQQEKYSMQIARQPSAMIDTSFLEETEMMTRYTCTIFTTSLKVKIKGINDFYTDFSRAVPPQLIVNA